VRICLVLGGGKKVTLLPRAKQGAPGKMELARISIAKRGVAIPLIVTPTPTPKRKEHASGQAMLPEVPAAGQRAPELERAVLPASCCRGGWPYGGIGWIPPSGFAAYTPSVARRLPTLICQ